MLKFDGQSTMVENEQILSHLCIGHIEDQSAIVIMTASAVGAVSALVIEAKVAGLVVILPLKHGISYLPDPKLDR